ncbi:hypothetical protein SCMU_10770 [Sinomonas cyclohexanicum]|uniref:HTH araC/xylS-type domain-containing protein n=1 Tax=Sinomonas cyclohexanicum TaxID=322009 RepID=A0ABN6FFS9_SINCY|nr:helix-turn-helix domain-containing protein [Corynebacterium cyclohexanicum]BCT75235.1 hypothetical protein SCMU_10770 [Corynebacterium cyclohexanicum]
MRTDARTRRPGEQPFSDLEACQARVSAAFATASIDSLQTTFSGAMRTHSGAGVRVSRVAISPSLMERSPRHIGARDTSYLVMCLLLSGRATVAQEGRRADLLPGEVSLYDTARPYSVQVDSPIDCIGVVVPREALAVTPRTVDALIASRMRGSDAVTTLARQTITGVEASLSNIPTVAAERAIKGLVDLCEMLYVHHGMSSGLPGGRTHVADMNSILTYIEEHLADPDLSPHAVASAHYISVRKLHKLAQESGISIGGWIRRRRLERCREDLADAALGSLAVGAIGARWGLGNPTHFSTMFRAEFKASPSECRAAHLPRQ